MTERKSLKRRVRARMEKSGERYTAARRHVVGEGADEPAEEDSTAARPSEQVSDEAVVARTGRTRDDWFTALDAWGARERTHQEIARHLREEHGVGGWWAQMVTVEYERARGLREKHERPDGFAVSTTRTVAVAVERLFDAFVEPDQRARWLPDVDLGLRTAQPGRSARFDCDGGRTRVHAYFAARGEAKSTVSLQHERLADAEQAERAKAEWRERLTRLKEVLESDAASVE